MCEVFKIRPTLVLSLADATQPRSPSMWPPLPHYERKLEDENLYRQRDLRREVYICPEVALVFNGADSLFSVEE